MIQIFDFGSQYTQLIARKIRENNVYCEIFPFSSAIEISKDVKGIILSGSPFSVLDDNAPDFNLERIPENIPVLGICYGAQLFAFKNKGTVLRSANREYGQAIINLVKHHSLFKDIPENSRVWMSHGDVIEKIPENCEVIANSNNINIAAYSNNHWFTGVQFHPEVYHTEFGKQILKNFVVEICKCEQNWTSDLFVKNSVLQLKNDLQDKKVIMGLSGGVDSTVAAVLLHKAIGKNLHCIFVDNGLLRKNEFSNVLASYKGMGLNISGVRKGNEFLSKLKSISDPEMKRKIIGQTFIEVFDAEAKKMKDIRYLAQGTIYPDVIESLSVNGPSATIKSHHNVGGLPKKMKLKIIEPLRLLFKDEVRMVGKELKIPDEILSRHPFPGPGLAIRIIGDINKKKLSLLREADDIFIQNLRKHMLYDNVWQAFVVLLPVQTVGVMGDERTYEFVVSLRAVGSTDGMTADWCHLPHEFLALVSNEIINKVRGINRVVYDISSKPPATIEWE